MRKWLKLANGLNPGFRAIPGFQPVYAADADMMNALLQETNSAEQFDLLYHTDDVEIYGFRALRQDYPIIIYDIRYIASLIGYEAWLVVAGVIPVNRVSQLDYQIKQAKKMLIDAVRDQWGIELMKGVIQ